MKPGPYAIGRRSKVAHSGDAGSKGCDEVDVGSVHARQNGKHPPANAVVSGSQVPEGFSTAEALRSIPFWAMVAAMYLHMVYGATITSHLLTALRTDAGMSVTEAAEVMAVQFAFAVCSKLLTGALLTLHSPPRALLFIGAPIAYAASHFLLLDVHPEQISTWELAHAVSVSHDHVWLRLYGAVVGTSFGTIFGLIQCLPIRLFGRRDLPTIQSLMYSSVLLANATSIPLMGALHDAFGGNYNVPFLVTFGASIVEVGLLVLLRRRDIEATAQCTPNLL